AFCLLPTFRCRRALPPLPETAQRHPLGIAFSLFNSPGPAPWRSHSSVTSAERSFKRNRLATNSKLRDHGSSTPCAERRSLHILKDVRLYGVGRGPACVLERLPEAVAGFVSCRFVSGEQRARKNQLQSNQQKDWQPYQIPKGRCGDRRRG